MMYNKTAIEKATMFFHHEYDLGYSGSHKYLEDLNTVFDVKEVSHDDLLKLASFARKQREKAYIYGYLKGLTECRDETTD